MSGPATKGPTVKGPIIKGWCPGSYRPMQSGDGLIMRVRPRLGQLTPNQMIGLCDISQTFGNGVIDLTNRANLQLRGIAQDNHQAVLDALLALDLLDETPELEARRNIICAPLRTSEGFTDQLAQELTDRLDELPDLPAKFGFAIDADGPPQLSAAPADIRIETGPSGLIVRADGSPIGQSVTPDTAVDALITIARWFSGTCEPHIRRMAAHLVEVPLPYKFANTASLETVNPLALGQLYQGRVFGASFGSLPANDLLKLLAENPTSTLTVTPFRMFILSGEITPTHTQFITSPNHPALNIDACPGAPACGASHIETRALARHLAPHLDGKSLHISGCTKGCARPRAADVVLVGQRDGFDLVLNGCSWDEPVLRGIKPDSVIDAITNALGQS
jgi:precorrin-3B synthase